MTTNNFKKAIENIVKNYDYASAITKLMHIEDACLDGTKCGSVNAAVIAVIEEEGGEREWRVYYNYNTMKNKIDFVSYSDYSEACNEFMKFAA